MDHLQDNCSTWLYMWLTVFRMRNTGLDFVHDCFQDDNYSVWLYQYMCDCISVRYCISICVKDCISTCVTDYINICVTDCICIYMCGILYQYMHDCLFSGREVWGAAGSHAEWGQSVDTPRACQQTVGGCFWQGTMVVTVTSHWTECIHSDIPLVRVQSQWHPTGQSAITVTSHWSKCNHSDIPLVRVQSPVMSHWSKCSHSDIPLVRVQSPLAGGQPQWHPTSRSTATVYNHFSEYREGTGMAGTHVHSWATVKQLFKLPVDAQLTYMMWTKLWRSKACLLVQRLNLTCSLPRTFHYTRCSWNLCSV